jgi:hypothetical protein
MSRTSHPLGPSRVESNDSPSGGAGKEARPRWIVDARCDREPARTRTPVTAAGLWSAMHSARGTRVADAQPLENRPYLPTALDWAVPHSADRPCSTDPHPDPFGSEPDRGRIGSRER